MQNTYLVRISTTEHVDRLRVARYPHLARLFSHPLPLHRLPPTATNYVHGSAGENAESGRRVSIAKYYVQMFDGRRNRRRLLSLRPRYPNYHVSRLFDSDAVRDHQFCQR